MRRIITGSLLLSTSVLLAACAGWPGAGTPAASAAAANCEVGAVPPGAVFGVRGGMDIATYPATAPREGSGCQRVWYGQRSRPEAMQVLATYYYDGGHVQRLIGQVPHGASYECHYRNGSLDMARSRNTANCPKESEARP